MWNNIKWKLQQFMSGRNGQDELCLTVFGISFVLYVILGLFRLNGLAFITMAGFIYALFRMFSRDVYKRQAENRKFLQEINLIKMRFSQRKTHRIYKCKGCGRKIRVPRGKGKIEITCPLCGRKFVKRT